MARTYHRDSKGRFAKSPGGGGGGRSSSGGSGRSSSTGVGKASRANATPVVSSGVGIQRLGGGTISREEAAAIMFGSGARKKLAGTKVRKRR
jgi:hypothetical protein